MENIQIPFQSKKSTLFSFIYCVCDDRIQKKMTATQRRKGKAR